MAIIYSYPGLPFKDLTGDDLFIITDVDNTTDNPTRSISLDNVVKYVKESAGSGVGTINRIPKFKNTGTTTLEDSILLQNTLATSVAVDGDLTFADNKKILLGGSSDLQLYHNATDSLIENITGDIDIINKATDKIVTIQATSDHTGVDVTDQYLALNPNFLSTVTNPGALFIYKDVLMASDDLKIRMGASQDLEIYHDATDSRIINSTGELVIDTGTLRVRNAAGTETVIVANSTSVELYQNNVKKLETTSAGITVTGTQSSFSGQVTIPTTPVASTDAASKAYVDSLTARKIFTSTSLDTTTDYNTAGVQTPIVWDSEIIKDSIYTHDNAVNPEQVTVTEAGTYRVYAMLTATSASTSRIVILLKIAVNGTDTGRLGAGMYIRGQSGIDKSSATIEETMVLNANDIITITGERGSNIGSSTFGVSGASFFSIEKIA